MNKEITKRSVLAVGDFCNSNCQFCYFRHKKKKGWEDLACLKNKVKTFRYFYRLGFVDIWGGEPTIYPDIFKLIKYCNDIGLKPTIITNSFALADIEMCKKFKAVGINDFLVSINGLDQNADLITGVKDASIKQKKAIDNLNQLNIPYRINVTLHKFVTSQLPEIADFAVNNNAKVMNMIVFNPYYEWQNIVDVNFQQRYSEMSEYIKQAIKILEENNLEGNIRYMPLCQLKGNEKNNYNYMQRTWDQYEWDHNSCEQYFLFKVNEEWNNNEVLRIRKDLCYQKSKLCQKCSVNYICDGFHNQYVKKFGFGEVKPYQLDQLVTDPRFFNDQQKRRKLSYQPPNISRFKYLGQDKKVILDFCKGRSNYLKYKINNFLND